MQKYMYNREYYIGYQRGLNEKPTCDTFWDDLNLNRLLNSTSSDDKERERGYRDGINARELQKWGKKLLY